MNSTYNVQFEKLCHVLDLGQIVQPPAAITGGLLHRMFAMETTKGKYAVKALNPQIMARPTAKDNYFLSEKIVRIASSRVPAHPARIHEGSFLQNIDDQYYMVFDWIEGCSLKASEITTDHCRKIGSLLAEIHTTDFSQIGRLDEILNIMRAIDWDLYLHKGRQLDSVWADLLQSNLERLLAWNEKALRSSRLLAAERVYSHRDLDPKNVMWDKGQPVIIDWESAGEINPAHDLIETAVYWSANEAGGIDKDKFLAFVEGYQEDYGKFNAYWEMVLDLGYLSKLEWLEYSLKRSLQIECTDEHEQEMGTRHVIETIHALKKYEEMTSILEAWLIGLS
jgi:Ser/Thr protein kinase RdoA (MazF antagonist)